MVPWLYKLSCTESRRFNSYFSLFLSFSKKKKKIKIKIWCLTAAAVLLVRRRKAIQSSGIHIPTWSFFFYFFFISLSLFSFCLAIPPLCLPSSLHPINAVAWLYKAHHDSINSVISCFFLLLLLLLGSFRLLTYSFLYFSIFFVIFFFFLQFWLVSSHFRMACIWIIYALFTNNFSLSSFK